MGTSWRWFVASIVASFLVALTAPPALAAHASLTLTSSAARVRFGNAVTLSGILTITAEGQTPEGQTVRIVDADAAEWATATVAPDGAYSVPIVPPRNLTLHAEWTDDAVPEAVVSDTITVGVRPLLTARIEAVYLFGRARVFGRLGPAHEGASVSVALVRGWDVVARRDAVLSGEGRYSVRFPIRRAGRYWARVRFEDGDHLAVADRTGRKEPPLPRLEPGSRSITVRFLEQRLEDLHYRVPRPDRFYDYRTADAVMAFNKVQGRDRVGSVTESTWRALVDPRRPRARDRSDRFHVEVDQTKQVLYLVRDGRITKILHVSTGQFEGWTRDGVWRVWGKIAGYSGNRLYYPSYFDGLRAVHGWPEVPPYPASHGCVRVPMWTATWIYDRMPIGTEVRIYHS